MFNEKYYLNESRSEGDIENKEDIKNGGNINEYSTFVAKIESSNKSENSVLYYIKALFNLSFFKEFEYFLLEISYEKVNHIIFGKDNLKDKDLESLINVI